MMHVMHVMHYPNCMVEYRGFESVIYARTIGIFNGYWRVEQLFFLRDKKSECADTIAGLFYTCTFQNRFTM